MFTRFPQLGQQIDGFYTILGKGGESNDRKREESVRFRQKVANIGHFEIEKGIGRVTTWRKFVETCKTISKYVKLSQIELEQTSIFDYLNYTELVNEEIEAHNKALNAQQKKNG